MKNFYDCFHNLFKVSKTLRFELIPIGKTKEYFAEYILKEDEKYAYAVILTTHPTRSAEEIIKLYELRPEIEEDFRQLKDFWGLTEYRSTQYHIISFVN